MYKSLFFFVLTFFCLSFDNSNKNITDSTSNDIVNRDIQIKNFDNKDGYVYRADKLSPKELKQQGGFFPRGSDGTRPNQPPVNTSLYNHTQGALGGTSRHNSGYVSTTADLDFARRFVQETLGGSGYIYRIHVSPNFIDAAGTLGGYYTHSEEQEFSALGNIHRTQVTSWMEIQNGAEGNWITNSAYDRRFNDLSHGGNQYHLAGFPENHPAWNHEPWRSFSNCHDKSQKRLDTEECSPKNSSLKNASEYMSTHIPKWIEYDQVTSMTETNERNNRYLLFRGDAYALWSIHNDGELISSGKIVDIFPSLKGSEYANGFDAILLNEDNSYYIFKDENVMHISQNNRYEEHKLVTVFKGLKCTLFEDGIDSIIKTKNKNEYLISKDHNVILYNQNTNRSRIINNGTIIYPNLYMVNIIGNQDDFFVFSGNSINRVDVKNNILNYQYTSDLNKEMEKLKPWLINTEVNLK